MGQVTVTIGLSAVVMALIDGELAVLTVQTGVARAPALPSQRSTSHFSTRMFSPKPGHMNLPSSSTRNQLTPKTWGRCSMLRPTLSQCWK